MAREAMVTRTLTTTKANVVCLDVHKNETFIKVVELPRTYKDNDALLKKVRSLIESIDVIPVYIDSTEVNETLYGMSEHEFIQHAKVLPLRNTETVNKKTK